MSLNLFQVLPATFIQESLETRTIYENLDTLYELDNEVRLALLDLIRLRKLKLSYGIVYTFGWNKRGELGNRKIGTMNNAITPSPIESLSNGERVVQVSVGTIHSLTLCEDGVVYAFGCNYFGQLGIGNTTSVSTPTPIDTSKIGDKKVIQVSAGDSHSLILCEDGTVYSCGLNMYGQLGTGTTDVEDTPTAINTLRMVDIEGDVKKVIQVSAGGSHSLILCEDGSVYSFGWNKYGQLGIGNTNHEVVPTEVNTRNIEGKRVVQVSAGGSHSLILCEDGSIYSFGHNGYGQLGTVSITSNKISPTKIIMSNISSKKVIQVSAGGKHSLILCEDGSVYSFGHNGNGQLGTGTSGHLDNTFKPTVINTLNMLDREGKVKEVKQVSAGFRYSLILCRDGTVYAFGSNKRGQLGTGDRNNQALPTLIDTSNIKGRVIQVVAGTKHSLILT